MNRILRVDGRTVYELNNEGYNKWSAFVQDAHTSQDELEQVAKMLGKSAEMLNALKHLLNSADNGVDLLSDPEYRRQVAQIIRDADPK